MNHRELAHKWAHAASHDSRRCGSMSFEGETLYSYGTPIAKIYRKGKRGKPVTALVLVSENSYSSTTAKHISHAFRAVSHLDALRAPNYIIGGGSGRYRGGRNAAEDHAANLAHFVESAAADLASAKRAHSRQAAAWRAESAARSLKEWQTYAAFFGIRRKAPAYPAAEWSAALQRADRIENPDPASLDKRERERAKRQERNHERDDYLAEQRRSMQEAKRKRDFWRIGAARTSWRLADVFGHDYEALRSSDCMLRTKGEQIETSWGARIPVAAAPMVWRRVQAARTGDTFERGLHSVKIGDYTLDEIDADGTLHAGCHTIPFSELASVARQLGLS